MKLLRNTSTSTHARLPFQLGLLALACAMVVFLSFVFPNVNYEYDEKGGSLLWSLLPDQEREERIVIVAIDEKSLSEVGSWPWPRNTMAELSDKLADYGAALQLFDIVFPETKLGDQAFSQALARNNVVLAQIPIFEGDSSLRSGELSGALPSTRCEFPIPRASSYLANTPALNAKSVGHITPIVDADGVIRKQPPLVCIEGRVYPSLALQGLLSSLGKKDISLSIKQYSGLFSSPQNVEIDSYFGLSIPLDNQGNMRLSYRQSPDSFQVVSAASVLNGSAPTELLNNAWVLVGATAFGLGDVVPTPHSGTTPGVELQARLLSNLLDGRTPYTPNYSNLLKFIFGVAAATILIVVAKLGNKAASLLLPIVTVLLPFCAWGLHTYLLTYSIWLGWLNLALFCAFAGTLFVLADHQLLRHQHLRIFTHLSSYLPKSVAQNLLHTTPSGAIEAKRHDLVLMCADLRNFSAYEESRPPEEAAALLHCFFVESTRIIENHNGQVEEYKGDSLLASWPRDNDQNSVQKALDAAAELQEMLSNILPQRPPKGLEPLALGIAIERGPTLVGSIGPVNRRHHTLLGDTVTIVLRIQEMTQDLAQPILIGECAARDLSGNELDSQGSFLLDGLTTPHVLFAPKSHHVDPLMDREDSRVFRIVRQQSS
ncbi:CHASE2 domain-containing protein [Marinomonas fungiae]|uniref:CHASE2 domain-containing protein n=1 Tax=Marinomonas fungiae TaxID=1137284 RepID=UPI003A8EDE13